MPSPKFFKSAIDFRRWLESNHDKKNELLVGFYKVGSGRPSMSWSESVDQALCFGWIDGVRKKIDEHSYSIRFTPRRVGSIWSSVNIRKVDDLLKNGQMSSAGVTAFEKRDEKKSEIYSYEKRPEKFPAELEKIFQKNKEAWKFFTKQPLGYRRSCIHFVSSAKQEKTRINRLDKLILASEAGKRLY